MPAQEKQTKDVGGGTKDEPNSVRQNPQPGQAKRNTNSPAKQTRVATLPAGIAGAIVSEDQIADV